MEQKFQSSFIPKGPVSTASPLSGAYAAHVSVKNTFFGYVATVLFGITLVLAIGVFGYERYLLSSIGTMGDNLTAARQTLEPDTINSLVKANQRITSTGALLAHHTALSPLFDYLENTTLKNVRFTGFTYVTDDKGETDLTMQGQAVSYTDVALQSDAFNKAAFLKSPTFSDLDLDNKGNVTFTFKAIIDPSIVAFKNRLDGMTLALPTAAITASSTATSTAATTTLKTVISTSTPVAAPKATSTATTTAH